MLLCYDDVITVSKDILATLVVTAMPCMLPDCGKTDVKVFAESYPQKALQRL